ncbi:MAG TPA: biotin--[acetyl-CoA-carboxylase] ligase [Roseivirga sp.]
MGKMVEYVPSCHSTNDSARRLLENTAIQEGFVLITDDQTKGRGQRGNIWLSEAGKNLTFSIIVRPTFLKVIDQFFLNIIASLAVRNAVADKLTGHNCQVKWPNDVLVNERKVCGILIENIIKASQLDYSIIGIGLNINQRSFSSPRATSLVNEVGLDLDLQFLFESVLLHFETLYLRLKSGYGELLKENYLQNLIGFRMSRRYRAEYEFTGEILDVLESGKLMVRTNRGIELFDFKEIEFIWN